MDFAVKIDTAASTYTEASPKKTILKVGQGRITGGWIYFPRGPQGYLHVIIRRGLHQLSPYNVGSNYSLDDCVIPLSFDLPLPSPPYELEILTWNDSTTYSHTCTVCIFLDPWAELNPRKSWLSRLLQR